MDIEEFDKSSISKERLEQYNWPKTAGGIRINDDNQLYLAVAIKKSEVNDTPSTEADAVSISDNISIADLIKKINPEAVGFLKYIPDNFLDEAQLEGKKIGIERDIKKYPNSPYKTQGPFSLSDTKGRELTKEQQEYFKDSKVRDENGNLKVMYHGSQEAFTVFDSLLKGGKNGSVEGFGIYLTDSAEVAQPYANNGTMYEGYVNITAIQLAENGGGYKNNGEEE